MSDSEQVLRRMHYWRPGLPPARAGLAGRSGLRMGLVGSREIFLDLEPEVNLFLLEPDNYSEVIEAVPLDLILVESAWNPLSRGWYQFQLQGTAAHSALHDLLKCAAASALPTGFWLTGSAAYVADYADPARHFDAVFCADHRAVEAFGALGIQASHVAPCFQPARFHPFHDDPFRRDGGHPVYFDGWADVDRGLVEPGLLEAVGERTGLAIFESRYRLPAPRLRNIPNLASHVRGCLTLGLHPVALQRAEVVLSLPGAQAERVAHEWQALKAVATGNVLVHKGALGEDDGRKPLVRAHTEGEAFLEDIEWLRVNPWQRTRVAHTAWREIMREHTMAHRLGQMCAELDLHHDWNPTPSVSVITPTRRPDNLERILKNFDKQRYPRKELRIVVNGAEASGSSRFEALARREDVSVDAVPADQFTGACMNRGHEGSQADYVIKLDDDDRYGEHYVSDVMLALRCVDADVFGKVPVPMRFEGEARAYYRRQRFKPWSVTSGKALRSGKIWLGGNTLGYRTRALDSPVFPDDVLGAADSVFNENCPEAATVLVLDPFNVLTERGADLKSHTWQLDRETLAARSDVMEDFSDVML